MTVAAYPTSVNVVTGVLSYPAGTGGNALSSGAVTTGDVTVSAQASWTVVPGISWTVAATAGQTVVSQTTSMVLWASVASDFFTACLTNGSTTILLRSDSGTNAATSSDEGDSSMYPIGASNIRTWGGRWVIPVTSGLLVNGSLNFGFASRGAGGAKIFASAGFPLRWSAEVRSA